jgi:hypothetical protein
MSFGRNPMQTTRKRLSTLNLMNFGFVSSIAAAVARTSRARPWRRTDRRRTVWPAPPLPRVAVARRRCRVRSIIAPARIFVRVRYC